MTRIPKKGFVISGILALFFLFLFKDFIFKYALTIFVHPGKGSIRIHSASLGFKKLIIKGLHLYNPLSEEVAYIENLQISWNLPFSKKRLKWEVIKPHIYISPYKSTGGKLEWNISFLFEHYKGPFEFSENFSVLFQEGEVIFKDASFMQHIKNIEGKILSYTRKRGGLSLKGGLEKGGIVTVKGPIFLDPIGGTLNIIGNKLPLQEWGNYFFALKDGNHPNDFIRVLDGFASINLTALIAQDKPDLPISFDLNGFIKVKEGVLKVPLIDAPFHKISGHMLIANDIIRFEDFYGGIGSVLVSMNGMSCLSQLDLKLLFSNLTTKDLALFEPLKDKLDSNIIGIGWGKMEIVGSVSLPRFSGSAFLSPLKFKNGSSGKGELAFSFFDNNLLLHDLNVSLPKGQLSGKGIVSFLTDGNVKLAVAGNITSSLKDLKNINNFLGDLFKIPVDLPGKVNASGAILGSAKNLVGSINGRWGDFSYPVNQADFKILLGGNNVLLKGKLIPGNSMPVNSVGYIQYKDSVLLNLSFWGSNVNFSSLLNSLNISSLKIASGNLQGAVLANDEGLLFGGRVYKGGRVYNKDIKNLELWGGINNLLNGKGDGYFLARSFNWPVTFSYQTAYNTDPLIVRGALNGAGYFKYNKDFGKEDKSWKHVGIWGLNEGQLQIAKRLGVPIKGTLSVMQSNSNPQILGILSSKNSSISLIGSTNKVAILGQNLPGNLINFLFPLRIQHPLIVQHPSLLSKTILVNKPVSIAGQIIRAQDNTKFTGTFLIPGFYSGSASGEISVDKKEVQLHVVNIRSSRGNVIISGVVPLNSPNLSKPFKVLIAAEKFPIDLLSKYLKQDIKGEISGTIMIQGKTSSPFLSGNAIVRHGSWFGQPFELAKGSFVYKDKTLELLNFDVHYRDSYVSGKGYYTSKEGLNISGSAPRVALADFPSLVKRLSPVAGVGSLLWNLKGPLSSPKGELELEFENLLLQGIPILNASGKFKFENGKFHTNDFTIKDNAGEVTVFGNASFPFFYNYPYILNSSSTDNSSTLDLKGEFNNLEARTLLSWLRKKLPLKFKEIVKEKVNGKIKGTFVLKGPFNSPVSDLKIEIKNASIGAIPFNLATLDLTAAKDYLDVKDLSVIADEMRFYGKGIFKEDAFKRGIFKEGAIKGVRADLQNFNLALLQEFFPKAKDIGGIGDLHLEMTGKEMAAEELKEKFIKGLASLEVRDGRIKNHTIDRLRALVVFSNGLANIQDLRIVKEGHKVRLTGMIPFEISEHGLIPRGPVNLAIGVDKESISFLPSFFPNVSKAFGDLTANIYLTGDPFSPFLTGKVNLNNGQLEFRGIRTPITGLSGSLEFKEEGKHSLNFKGVLGGGSLDLTGNGTIKDLRLKEIEAVLSVKKGKIDVPSFFNGTINANLVFKREGVAQELKEGVAQELKEGVAQELTGHILTEQSNLAFPSSIPSSFTSNHFNLNVALLVGDRVTFRHPLVNVRIAPGEIKLLGSSLLPYLEGVLLTHQGNIFFLSNNFRINRGRAMFSKEYGLMPFLETEAGAATSLQRMYVGGIGRATILMRIHGLPNQLNVELSSQPSLSTKDIISMLTGEQNLDRLTKGSNLNRYLGQEAVNLLTHAVSSHVLFGVEEVFANTFNLDLFALEFLPTGNFGLKVGKEFANKFYITYNRSFTSTRQVGLREFRSLWGIEYLFNPFSSLWLTVDDVGEYNTGIKARWNF